jgi:hypothetical protein
MGTRLLIELSELNRSDFLMQKCILELVWRGKDFSRAEGCDEESHDEP